MRAPLVSLMVVFAFVAPLFAGAESLVAGTSTALDPKEARETERVVERIQQLAEESRRGAPQFSMLGEVTGGGSSWWINGEEFFIDATTVITGELRSGMTAEVRGLLGDGKKLRARHVTVFEQARDSANTAQRGISKEEARALR